MCDKTIKLKSKKNHFKSLTHKEYKKHLKKTHTIENPIFFDVDKTFNDYITNHDKKIDIYLVRVDFKLDFDNYLNAKKRQILISSYHPLT